MKIFNLCVRVTNPAIFNYNLISIIIQNM